MFLHSLLLIVLDVDDKTSSSESSDEDIPDHTMIPDVSLKPLDSPNSSTVTSEALSHGMYILAYSAIPSREMSTFHSMKMHLSLSNQVGVK